MLAPRSLRSPRVHHRQHGHSALTPSVDIHHIIVINMGPSPLPQLSPSFSHQLVCSGHLVCTCFCGCRLGMEIRPDFFFRPPKLRLRPLYHSHLVSRLRRFLPPSRSEYIIALFLYPSCLLLHTAMGIPILLWPPLMEVAASYFIHSRFPFFGFRTFHFHLHSISS